MFKWAVKTKQAGTGTMRLVIGQRSPPPPTEALKYGDLHPLLKYSNELYPVLHILCKF